MATPRVIKLAGPRGKAAFTLGAYCPWIGCDGVAEALAELHRDIPYLIHVALSDRLLRIQHLYGEMTIQQSRSKDWESDGYIRLQEVKAELELIRGDYRRYADRAILRYSELRPLFDLGKALEVIRDSFETLPIDRGVNDARTAVNIVMLVSSESGSPGVESKVLEGGIREFQETISKCPKARMFWESVIEQFNTVSNEQPRKLVDELLQFGCVRAESFELERCEDLDDNEERDTWLWEQRMAGVSWKALVKGLREVCRPHGQKHWIAIEESGVREAVERFATKNGLSMPPGKPGRPPGKRDSSVG